MSDQKKPTTLVTKMPSSPDLSNIGMALTMSDLNTILEVNQKALTIYLEVEKQNDQMIVVIGNVREDLKSLALINEHLKDIKRDHQIMMGVIFELKVASKEYEKKMSDIDKAIFRLYLVLGSTALGAMLNFVQLFLHK